jgi:DNA-binding transcriptional regulator GbsR (MarR family)
VELNRCGYAILRILKTEHATDKAHGLTVEEITEMEKVSKSNTIHKKIKEMQSQGYVEEGAKAAKAKTYFLTTRGQDMAQIFKEEESA